MSSALLGCARVTRLLFTCQQSNQKWDVHTQIRICKLNILFLFVAFFSLTLGIQQSTYLLNPWGICDLSTFHVSLGFVSRNIGGPRSRDTHQLLAANIVKINNLICRQSSLSYKIRNGRFGQVTIPSVRRYVCLQVFCFLS